MRALVSGSLAFDFIMHFPGRFADHLDVGRRHGVSVAFTTPTMRRAFGGCAGNIAYGLKKLGDDPVMAATVGADFAPYRARLQSLDISAAGVREHADAFTAQAYIVTDNENSQITLFHPGAMNFAHEVDVAALAESEGGMKAGDLAIISPNGREGMLAHAESLSARGFRVVWDVGQAVGLFNGGELRRMLECASFAIFNRHEFDMTAKAAEIDEERGGGNGGGAGNHGRRRRVRGPWLGGRRLPQTR